MVSAVTLKVPISARVLKAMPQAASHHHVLVRTQLQDSSPKAMVLSTNISFHSKTLSISSFICNFLVYFVLQMSMNARTVSTYVHTAA